MKSDQALDIVALALTASPEAIKALVRERVALVASRGELIDAMDKARLACGCHTLKPPPPTPCEPCAIIDAALLKHRR